MQGEFTDTERLCWIATCEDLVIMTSQLDSGAFVCDVERPDKNTIFSGEGPKAEHAARRAIDDAMRSDGK